MSQSTLPKGFLWGFATARLVTWVSLTEYPAMESAKTVFPSRTEFEATVTRSKVRRMKTAVQTPSGTVSAAFLARLLAESQEKWPATPTTAPPKTLTF
jgi:hypothetical protein